MSQSLVTTPNTIIWTGFLVFLNIGNLLGIEQVNGYSISSPSDSSWNFSQNMSGWRRCFSLLKSFWARSFFLSFIACDKNSYQNDQRKGFRVVILSWSLLDSSNFFRILYKVLYTIYIYIYVCVGVCVCVCVFC